jgi:DNA invertase Pin-like site-specific DNA recombinase
MEDRRELHRERERCYPKTSELFRLLSDCEAGDVLLVEQVDRLRRSSANNWDRLKHEIQRRHVGVVALDLPTSWSMISTDCDDIHTRVSDAINAMLAAIASNDRHQPLGVECAQPRCASLVDGQQGHDTGHS